MKKLCLLLTFSLLLIFLTGCWDYREIEDATIVNIICLDKDEKTKEYILSIEVMDVKGLAQGVDVSPQIIEARGTSIIDAVRNLISITTKVPYWSHVTMVILSQEIAKEGIVPVLDWIARSPELQLTLNIFVSKEKTAKEILRSGERFTMTRIFEYETISKAFRFLAKLPYVKANKVINEVQSKELYTVIPTVETLNLQGDTYANFIGSAYFKEGKLEGFFSPIDTMKYLFVLNHVKGGALVVPTDGEGEIVSLSIYKNTTKIKIDFIDDNIEINVNIKPVVSIAEIDGVVDYTSKEGRKILKEKADLFIENEIQTFIEGVQKNPGIDVFNFGNKIKKRHPGLWKKIEEDWPQIFREVSIKVNSDIKIKSSQHITTPIGADIK